MTTKIKWRDKHYLEYPWLRAFDNIHKRCCQPSCHGHKYYKNIRVLITAEELKTLWFRDKAYLMKHPSIDRINNRGDYVFANCRYIELSENKSHTGSRISVKQFDLEGNFIREWESLYSAAKALRLTKWSIRSATKGKYKTAGGFRWGRKPIRLLKGMR